jgi:hypothetical protein
MLLGGALFVTSAWFLHIGRFAGLDIEYLTAILALLAVHIGLQDHTNRPLALYAWLIVNLLLLFIPGFVWLVVGSALWQWRTLVTSWRHLDTIWNRLAWSLLALAGSGVLIYVLIRHASLIRQWLGLPEHFEAWQHILQNISQSYTALIYHAPFNPELWVGHLPLLDVFASAMMIMGLIFYALHWRAQRTHLLLGYFALGGILAGISGPVRISILMPVVYLVVTAGTAYALHFWLRMFPRNPLARGVGICLMTCLVLLAALYNLKLYYQVWPHNPDTSAIESRR